VYVSAVNAYKRAFGARCVQHSCCYEDLERTDFNYFVGV